MAYKLKSLRELKSFDGEKYSAEIPRDEPLAHCSHKDVQFSNGELRCKCGAAWRGANIHKLHELLTKA